MPLQLLYRLLWIKTYLKAQKMKQQSVRRLPV